MRGPTLYFQVTQWLRLATVLALTGWNICRASDYAEEIRRDQPVAWWRFIQQSGGNSHQASDEFTRHNGVCRGGVSLETGLPGTGGGAARFDGGSGYIEVPDHPDFALDSLSVEFWCRSTQRWDVVNWPGSATLVSKATSGAVSSDWTLIADTRVAGTLGRIHVFSGAAGAATDGQPVSRGGLNDGHWHHVVWTRADSGLNRLFVDGRLADMAEDGGGAITNSRPIQIGGDPWGHGSFLDGWLAEVAVYRAALAPDRVVAHFNAAVPEVERIALGNRAASKPLETLLLTNQAGMRWELLRAAAGWTLGGVTLRGRALEATNQAGVLLLRHRDTGEERWLTAATAERVNSRTVRCSGETKVDGVAFRFGIEVALDEALPAARLTPRWSVDRELKGWEVCLAYHDQFASDWRVQSYPWAGNSSEVEITPMRYCGVPGALLYRPDLSLVALYSIDARTDYLNPTTWTGQTDFRFRNGLTPPQFCVGGGKLSPGQEYSYPLQLFLSDAGDSPQAITELVRAWMWANDYQVERLPLARPLDESLALYLEGRRNSRVWVPGIGYEHALFPDGRGVGFVHLCNLAYSAYLEYRLYELTGDSLWRDRAFTQLGTLLKAQQTNPAEPHFGAMHDNYQLREDRGHKAGTFHSQDWAHDGYKPDVMAHMVRYILLTWERVKHRESLDRQEWYQAAVRCAEWILKQQNEDGGLPQVVDISTGRKSHSVVSHRALPAMPYIARVTGDARFAKLSADLERFLREKVEGRYWFTGSHPDLPPNDFEQDSVWGAVEYWLDKHDRTGDPEALVRAVADVHFALLYWCPKQLSWVKRPTQCAHSEQQHFNQYSVYCFQNRKVECLDRLAQKTGDRLYADLRDRVIALNVFTQVTKPGDWLGGFSEAIADPWLERKAGFEWVGSTYTSELCTDFFLQLVEMGLAKPGRQKETAEVEKSSGLPEPVAVFRGLIRSRQVEPFTRAASTLRQWMLANDPHYPKYHFTGPESWINDPNGPIFYAGRYHLFYQFDPCVDGKRRGMTWGHAVSTNLVHWQDWPVALWPDTPEDRGGVYSGNTFVDPQGRLCALYTGNVSGHAETYGILARSADEGVTWRKQVVLQNRQRPNPESPVHWDGFTWGDGDQWHQLIGGRTGGTNSQGAAFLWTSQDLENWRLQKNIAPSIRLGEFWELPYLIPLSGRHVLLVGCGNPYWVGNYDRTAMIFSPDQAAPRQVDTGHYYSFNLNMTDSRGPGGARRQLMHGWVTGPPTPTKTVPFWQGAHSIPRVLRLVENRLWQEPAPEIECLRGSAHRFTRNSELPALLRTVKGDALEIVATFEPGTARQFGLKVRVSGDDKEFTRVWFDNASRRFGVDGPTPARNAAELKEVRASGEQDSLLPPGSSVTMRVFLDRSIVEVFVNGVAYTARTFPPPDALGLEVFAEGGEAPVKSCAVYEMQGIWQPAAQP